MNRERLLFVAVLVIVALWFVTREAPQPARTAQPKIEDRELLAVKSTDLPPRLLVLEHEPFTVQTNERPTERPLLEPPAPRELPNLWLPTSASPGVGRWGMLRHPFAAPVEGGASIELPVLEGPAEGDAAGPEEAASARTDTWVSFNQPGRGQVVAMAVGGRVLRAPGDLPEPGPLGEWHRLLLLLEVDPDKAQQDGVSQVEVVVEVDGQRTGTVTQDFPGDIHTFRIAVAGRTQGWYEGAKAWLRLPDGGFNRHVAVARDLIARGKQREDPALLRWAQLMLDEARGRIPSANQAQLRDITLLMLDVADELNEEERVLALAFQHLARFPREEVVIEYVGNMLASRSFGLLRQAEQWLAKAPNSRSAQVSRVEVLLRLGDYETALQVVGSGRAGSGAQVDLLAARAALAVGDLDTARTRARSHAGGSLAAAANQILGGVAYAQGDAGRAQEHFRRAVEAAPRRSTAYSDLGLALAAQGREADAIACFDRAVELDFENTVIPALAKALMRLEAGSSREAAARARLAELDPQRRQDQKAIEEAEAEIAAAQEAEREQVGALRTVLDNNPRDLLVRYCLGYGLEQSDALDEAAAAYRAVLDQDYRYRIAIARLGVVQAKRVEEGGDRELIREAVANLNKAMSLHPQDPVLPYLLGRFLYVEGGSDRAAEADRAFARVVALPAPEADPDLPFWAQYGRAGILYRDPRVEELDVKVKLNTIIDEIRERVARQDPSNQDKLLEAHPVYQAVARARATVEKYESLVDVLWEFETRPRDWDLRQRAPMSIAVVRDPDDARGDGPPDGRIEFRGRVSYGGAQRDNENVLEFCGIRWPGEESSERLAAGDLEEIVWSGAVGEGARDVEFGAGVVGKGRGRRGPAGIQVRRARNGRIEVRLDGGDSDLFKRVRDNWVELDVEWPLGPYRIRIEVVDRRTGEFKLFLRAGGQPEVNVIRESQVGRDENRETEECSLFGTGRGSNPVDIVAWVEGRDGYEFEDATIDWIRITKQGRN